MDFEIMKTIAHLHNEGKTKECVDLIVENIAIVNDAHSFDFIINCLELTAEMFSVYGSEYKKIYEHLNKMEEPNMRCCIRMGRLKQLIEDAPKDAADNIA